MREIPVSLTLQSVWFEFKTPWGWGAFRYYTRNIVSAQVQCDFWIFGFWVVGALGALGALGGGQ